MRALRFLGAWFKNIHDHLEGVKTIIGVIALYIEDKYKLFDLKVWYVDVIIILIYIWTGYGVVDKVRRNKRAKREI